MRQVLSNAEYFKNFQTLNSKLMSQASLRNSDPNQIKSGNFLKDTSQILRIHRSPSCKKY